MNKIKGNSVQAGNSYVKAGDRNRVIWVVAKIWQHVDGLTYARLHKSNAPVELLTVSAVTLADTKYFEPVTSD
jgi:hypothetical protein